MITIKPTDIQNTIRCEVNGKITEEDLKSFEEFYQMHKPDQGKVNFLIVLNDMEGFTFKGLMEDLKLAKHMKEFNKFAIVSDEKWVEASTELEDLLPGVDVEHFSHNEEEKAKEYLAA
ncbi:STAS/SEC14 domain-containing protein [Pontibacillus yanchengensis]|uniref:STAS/SEC14 domain-containing protein n=1 Tax=Pontibacillus yanchengensis Y32 TaxID=1385514 RepID=A0A0A2TH26_9BACI|nr:STAS/SEC14 domain-containing protein [Pontibacillus yanchengensis]KGP73758.1 hypothetical protein N782_02485 [Pontibacillus yanchengensis Y32]